MLQNVQELQGSALLSPPNSVMTEDADGIEIDVGLVAKKALVTFVLTITNSILTITVGVTKLTGFTIICGLALGWLTKPLHAANVALSKHAFTPFHDWSEALSKENERIIETDKVIRVKNTTLLFYPQRYGKQAFDSLRMALAPISLALSVTNAVLWIATKPAYAALYVPGPIADGIIILPVALNKGIGYLTYLPLKELSDKMFDFQCNWLDRVIPKD